MKKGSLRMIDFKLYHQCVATLNIRYLQIFLVVLLLNSGAQNAFSISLGSAIRNVAKVSDDVPINRLDDFINNKATLEAAQDLAKRSTGRIDDLSNPDVLSRILRTTLKNVDPKVLKQIDELDIPSKQAALVLSHGAEQVRGAIPDLALRSTFLTEAGAGTLFALGRYDDLMTDAIRYNTVAKAGLITNATSPATMETFGNFFTRNGDIAHHFWTTTVRPNWKTWATGTALTTVMLAPDEYLDAAGDLTEEGIRKLVKAGTKIMTGVIKGSGEAVKKATSETVGAIYETYFKTATGVLALCITLSAISVFMPFTRKFLMRFIHRRFQKSQIEASTNAGESK